MHPGNPGGAGPVPAGLGRCLGRLPLPFSDGSRCEGDGAGRRLGWRGQYCPAAIQSWRRGQPLHGPLHQRSKGAKVCWEMVKTTSCLKTAQCSGNPTTRHRSELDGPRPALLITVPPPASTPTARPRTRGAVATRLQPGRHLPRQSNSAGPGFPAPVGRRTGPAS